MEEERPIPNPDSSSDKQPGSSQAPQTSARESDGPRVGVMILCVALAFIFWLLNALSQSHTATVPVRLQWNDIPEDKVAVSELPERAYFNVSGKGWQLLYDAFSPRTVGVDMSRFGDRTLLLTDYNRDLFARDLPRDLQLLDVYPDTILIDLDVAGTTTVPLRLQSDLTFSAGYGQSSAAILSPDSVSINGPSRLIDSISYWPTELVQAGSLDEDAVGSIALESPGVLNLKLTSTEVEYRIPVEAFTEGRLEVPIANLAGLDSNVRVLPSRVSVAFQSPLSRFDEVEAEDFRVEADLASVHDSASTHLEIQLTKVPDFVRNVGIDPDRVQFYVIEEEPVARRRGLFGRRRNK